MNEKIHVKVLIAIPNMGYAHSEAYGNRLMNFMSMGNLQTEMRVYHQMMEKARSLNPEFADELEKEIKPKTTFVKNIDDHVFEFFFVNIGRIFTPAAREEAAEWAVKGGMDYLFFIDDDMIAQDDLFLKLYRHNAVADIVCPLAFTRNPPHKPVLYSAIEGWDPIYQKDYFINQVVMKYPKDKLVRADACGFGAALIKTWIFKKLEKPWFMSSCGSGEDILFCFKSKKVGAKIYMDTSVKLGHLGNPVQVTEAYAEEFRNRIDPMNEKRYSNILEDKAVTIIGDK